MRRQLVGGEIPRRRCALVTCAKKQKWIVENVPVMAKTKKSGDFDNAQMNYPAASSGVSTSYL
jgi:hypothetical protein